MLNHPGSGIRAVDTLQTAATYEFGKPGNNVLTTRAYPVHLRGMAYLDARLPKLAALEFQKILGRPGVMTAEIIAALAHLGLARAYIMDNDPVKAKRAYEDFFDLWKDADPDIPVLITAKSEYAKLK